MPYIESRSTRASIREKLQGLPISNEGDLNFAITCLVDEYVNHHQWPRYTSINAAIGVLECLKLEFYRRIAAPYEDKKQLKNGDVYDHTFCGHSMQDKYLGGAGDGKRMGCQVCEGTGDGHGG
jgi:hypothetical protein